jgi:septal ring factor EnvC (AmiA/AmiB activator)
MKRLLAINASFDKDLAAEEKRLNARITKHATSQHQIAELHEVLKDIDRRLAAQKIKDTEESAAKIHERFQVLTTTAADRRATTRGQTVLIRAISPINRSPPPLTRLPPIIPTSVKPRRAHLASL